MSSDAAVCGKRTSAKAPANGRSKCKEEGSPFLMNKHGHPDFQPVKQGTKVTSNLLQPPKPPKRPLTAYLRFRNSIIESAKLKQSDLPSQDRSTVSGQMWRELPLEEKKKFQDAWLAEKEKYDKAMKVYYSSSEYNSYQYAMKKAQQVKVEFEKAKKFLREDDKQDTTGQPDITPAEDPGNLDPDENLNDQKVAANRYLQNHKLMNRILQGKLNLIKSTGGNEGILHRLEIMTQVKQAELESEIAKGHKKKKLWLYQDNKYYRELKNVYDHRFKAEDFPSMVEKARIDISQQKQQQLLEPQMQQEQRHQQQQLHRYQQQRKQLLQQQQQLLQPRIENLQKLRQPQQEKHYHLLQSKQNKQYQLLQPKQDKQYQLLQPKQDKTVSTSAAETISVQAAKTKQTVSTSAARTRAKI